MGTRRTSGTPTLADPAQALHQYQSLQADEALRESQRTRRQDGLHKMGLCMSSGRRRVAYGPAPVRVHHHGGGGMGMGGYGRRGPRMGGYGGGYGGGGYGRRRGRRC